MKNTQPYKHDWAEWYFYSYLIVVALGWIYLVWAVVSDLLTEL